MTRMLYILGVCALVAALAVIGLSVQRWNQNDPVLDELCDRPGVVAVFQQREDQRAEAAEAMTSPLLLQAEMLGNYLNPPRPVVAEGAAEGAGGVGLPSLVSEPVTSKAVSADFRVVAVSCYAERPERSMVWLEPAVGGEGKWGTKAGTGTTWRSQNVPVPVFGPSSAMSAPAGPKQRRRGGRAVRRDSTPSASPVD
jgi:hypothetical protein